MNKTPPFAPMGGFSGPFTNTVDWVESCPDKERCAKSVTAKNEQYNLWMEPMAVGKYKLWLLPIIDGKEVRTQSMSRMCTSLADAHKNFNLGMAEIFKHFAKSHGFPDTGGAVKVEVQDIEVEYVAPAGPLN